MTAVLEIENIKRSFYKGSGKNRERIDVLKGANLTMNQGEMVALVAPSGSGKSTLLNIVGLLDAPSSGTIRFNNKIVSKASEANGVFGGFKRMFTSKDASDSRKTMLRGEKIGFIYQFHHLLPELTVLENVVMPMLARDKNEKEAKKKAKFLLEWVGLWKSVIIFRHNSLVVSVSVLRFVVHWLTHLSCFWLMNQQETSTLRLPKQSSNCLEPW